MDFSAIADDFFVNVDLRTTLPLPRSRESVLHFFEAVQRDFPAMTSFYERETGEFVLEGDRSAGSYQWLEMLDRNLAAGAFNPPQLDSAYELHRWLLERSVYYVGLSGLDTESLDVLFGFNVDYTGNRDAIVAEAVLGGSPLATFLCNPSVRPVECEPGVVVALDDDCALQARLHIETRSSSYQVRTGEYSDEPISVYLTVRQYPRTGGVFDTKAAFARQCELCEDLTVEHVIPHVLQPISAAIATQ
ncbi:MAG: hypothetical protein KGY99_05905 [Phycisphaerae bacterium]|nr:hypothetical protein [Phycisphaerae bacterium]